MDKVWIELDRNGTDEENTARAEKATAMLKKLGVDYGKHGVFWWHDEKRRYCVTIDSAGGFMECGDNGHWFNLDYLAK